jgi:ubiquinone/menaquinone biosynthesis C-methylase UbiE
MGNKLNLGCGRDYKNGWVNVDSRKNIHADVIHDLNKFPYPFEKNNFDEVYVSHILEHLDDPVSSLKEIIRVSKKGAKVIVKVPHAFSYANVTDMQHKTNFTENSFTVAHMREYELEVSLKLLRKEFEYPSNSWKRFIPFKKYLKVFLNGIYDDLIFEFEVVK